MDSRQRFLHWRRVLSEEVTRKDSGTRRMEEPGQAARPEAEANPRPLQGWAVTGNEKEVGKPVRSRRLEKPLARAPAPVPQTDTGGQGEHPETNGRSVVKELGKMTP